MPKRNEDGNPHPLRWTPGKWEIYTYSVGEGDFEGIGIKDQHGNVLQDCFHTPGFTTGHPVTEDEKEYNAHLMAAAPELYAILAEILDNAVVNGYYREKAEKIMAKARGEEE